MPLSPREIRARLRKEGWIERERGSHTKFYKDGKLILVPRHIKDLKVGTYESIIKKAGWK
ncbi:MAG: type II toxin-antitoxin system HicA family toxin [Coriobacteriia bacterium]|nr:type II toxin-antitoxin system HicA family toxin [Coriobacteriia bacterium]